jgi:hypothetical protein
MSRPAGSCLPADQEAVGRLAAAMIGLAAARRTGDFAAAAAAAERAEVLAGAVARDKLARHPEALRGRLGRAAQLAAGRRPPSRPAGSCRPPAVPESAA